MILKKIFEKLTAIHSEMVMARRDMEYHWGPRKEVFYLCDGEKEDCGKRTCYKYSNEKDHPCKWTKDINHAVNFEKGRDSPLEIYREKETAPRNRVR